MNKEQTKKYVEGRKAYHKSILDFHTDLINWLGRKESKNEEEIELLKNAVRSSVRVKGLIDRDEQELREIERL